MCVSSILLFFKHYSKLTCENQEREIFFSIFSDLLARAFQIWQDVSILKTGGIFKTILLGFFAGMFIGFAGIASTTASSTIGIASVAKLVGAAVFPAGMAMVLVAGSELFTGNNLIILAVLEKRVSVWKMLKKRIL